MRRKRTNPADVSLEVRFWSRVGVFDHRDPAACAPWTGSVTAAGYGQLTTPDGHKIYAHRCAVELTQRPLEPGEMVRHRCPNGPNRQCVRPCHLEIGGAKANAADREADGRHRVLEPLSEDDVVAIRYLYKCQRFSQGDLSQLFFGTPEAQSLIARIVQGKTYRVTGGPTTTRGRGRPPKRRRERLR